jgi:hypothetical protein
VKHVPLRLGKTEPGIEEEEQWRQLANLEPHTSSIVPHGRSVLDIHAESRTQPSTCSGYWSSRSSHIVELFERGNGRDPPQWLPLIIKFPFLLFHLQDTSAGRRTGHLSRSLSLWRRLFNGDARTLLADRSVTVPGEPCAGFQFQAQTSQVASSDPAEHQFASWLETVNRQLTPLSQSRQSSWLSTSMPVLLGPA